MWWVGPLAVGSWVCGLLCGLFIWHRDPKAEPAAESEPHCQDEVPMHQWGKWSDNLERVHLDATYGYSQSRACDLCGVKQSRLVKLNR